MVRLLNLYDIIFDCRNHSLIDSNEITVIASSNIRKILCLSLDLYCTCRSRRKPMNVLQSRHPLGNTTFLSHLKYVVDYIVIVLN